MNVKFTVNEKELIEFKKRRRVRSLLTSAVKNGKLVRPLRCELCQGCQGRIEAHHSDYGKPFDVVWLCIPCHKKAHQPDSPMNPDNVVQTPMPDIVDKYKKVTVTFELPIENFIALKREADKRNQTLTKLITKQTLELYQVDDGQLQFTFEEQPNDDPQNVQHSGVPSVEKGEEFLLQPQGAMLQKVRSKRDYNLQGMERKLSSIPIGHGTHAPRLHRACAVG